MYLNLWTIFASLWWPVPPLEQLQVADLTLALLCNFYVLDQGFMRWSNSLAVFALIKFLDRMRTTTTASCSWRHLLLNSQWIQIRKVLRWPVPTSLKIDCKLQGMEGHIYKPKHWKSCDIRKPAPFQCETRSCHVEARLAWIKDQCYKCWRSLMWLWQNAPLISEKPSQQRALARKYK